MTPQISVVVNVKDGAATLAWALASVQGWADEILVADMASVDGSADIARRLGARVMPVADAGGFADPARAATVAAARGDWILVLDADEMVPRSLAAELTSVAARGTADAVYVPRRNFLLGHEIRHSGWGLAQDPHLRFFRQGYVLFSPRVHVPPAARDGTRIVYLPPVPELAMVHFNYVDSSQFLAKLDRYTSIEAAQRASDASPVLGHRVIASAVREFAARYVRRRGYRDGWRGAYLAFLMSVYRVVARAKQLEIAEGGSDGIRRGYAQLAADLIAEYENADGDVTRPGGGVP